MLPAVQSWDFMGYMASILELSNLFSSSLLIFSLISCSFLFFSYQYQFLRSFNMYFSNFSCILLLTVSALVSADVENGGHYGGGPNRWIKDFDNLVAFGDSYTDESRLTYFQNHNGSAPPPGTTLPASNSTAGGGVTWARWISNYTGAKLYNYAVSGAVCDNNIISRYLDSISGPFPDVIYETDAFVADVKYVNQSTHTNTFYPNRRADNTVYSMWIGTNDLGVDGFLTDSSLHETVITDYVDCVYDRFDAIYTAGGRKFVLMNTAPLQLSPLYGMAESGGLTTSHYWPDKPSNISEISGKMKEYTKLVNNIFSYRTAYEVLIAKRYSGASFAIFDVNTLMTDIYNNPTRYLDSPANVTGQYITCDVNAVDWWNACTAQVGREASQFLWYDELHPSERTDTVIAKEFVKIIEGTSKYASYW